MKAPCEKESAVESTRRRPWLWVALCLLAGLGLALGYWLIAPPQAFVPVVAAPPEQIALIALGDQGSGALQQWRVARAMERVAARDRRLDLVVLLGDNFYGPPLSGTGDMSWQLKFERVYWGRWLNHVPFYAVLGNHDYPESQQVELDYSQEHKGSGRWQMPARYYQKDFGQVQGRPLLRVVFLDTAAPRETLAQQVAFLQQAFAQPGPRPVWRMVAAHHPLRSAGRHGNDEQLLQDLLPALQRSQVDLYLAGHEHNQQLLLEPGEPAWVISGAGGQKLYEMPDVINDRQFSSARAGFAKLDFSAEQLQLVFYDERGTPEQRYRWQRQCRWLAKGCLLPQAEVR
ncbi:metallophosphoesterase [Pseudomonas sp. 3MA1]|uniref:metallophosphoesterase n=1 Tax=Pseudomonas sp. 3MA1 TaxID=2699196 RepID=UPI0002E96648|nr:metallophosphoesterase [Pseudomonas sp. 3MA1]